MPNTTQTNEIVGNYMNVGLSVHEGWMMFLLAVAVIALLAWVMYKRRNKTVVTPGATPLTPEELEKKVKDLEKKVTDLESDNLKLRTVIGKLADTPTVPSTAKEAEEKAEELKSQLYGAMTALQAAYHPLMVNITHGNIASNAGLLKNYLLGEFLSVQKEESLRLVAEKRVEVLEQALAEAQKFTADAVQHGANAQLNGLLTSQDISDRTFNLMSSFAATAEKARSLKNTGQKGASPTPAAPIQPPAQSATEAQLSAAVTDAVRLFVPGYYDPSETDAFTTKHGGLKAVQDGLQAALSNPPVRKPKPPKAQKGQGQGPNQPQAPATGNPPTTTTPP